MHTIAAWSQSVNPAGAFTKINAVTDQHIKVSGTKIYVPAFNQIIGALACAGATAPGEVRITSPSLRRVNPFYVTPVDNALVPISPPAGRFFADSPIPLDVNESLECECSSTPGAVAQLSFVVALANGAVPPVSGLIYTADCNITVTLVAGAWAYSEITFPDDLPIANYDVVGARLQCAAGVAFRLIPVGAALRPGGWCVASVQAIDALFQRCGGLGVWCSFNTVSPPGVEVLSSAAAGSATYELYLDLIKR